MTHAERWDGGVAQEGPVDAGVRAGWPARRKWAAGVAGVVLIVVVGGGVVAARWFGRGEPPWWEASNPLSPRVVRNAGVSRRK